ncbi:SPFH domain-containing protein [Brevibacterium samyangense]|uniref:SPFH domain-containing protein n=1 Tax=Brevibacterium samyangense TaxID=366888 RepID=A0ABN2T6E6_9MICO
MEAAFVLVPVVVVIIIAIVVLALLFGGLRTSIFFTVHTQENVIVERFGKFKKVAKPGLNTKVPFIETITRPISLRVQQLEVVIETKTRDNVFVTIPVAVQYLVNEANVADAYYRLANPEEQIRSYVFDTVRSALSTLTLDRAFESKDDIGRSVEERLSQSMGAYGFRIVNTLVTDIAPDPRVRDSMNSINAAQRDREAAQALAEADKIKRVTQAEAEAESKRLQGVGIAAQRKAIAIGIAEQFEMLKAAGINETAEQLLLMTQYFDTMQDVARNGRSNVLFLPSNPGSIGDLSTEIRNALLATQEADHARRESEEEIDEQAMAESRRQLREQQQEQARIAERSRQAAAQAAEAARRHGVDLPPGIPGMPPVPPQA